VLISDELVPSPANFLLRFDPGIDFFLYFLLSLQQLKKGFQPTLRISDASKEKWE